MRPSSAPQPPLAGLGRQGMMLLALFMTLALTLTGSLLFPQTALGRSEFEDLRLSDGYDHRGDSPGQEGDPLDSNDSDNGAGGGIEDQRRALPGGVLPGGVFPIYLPGNTADVLYRLVTVVENGRVRWVVIVQPVRELVPGGLYVR
ncbi:hypothetical protein CSB20_05260 [bacterium DOLZORAL124_64_63]|nr:MAG: hypothetical protein CSB20_05260 [bacterium DOLZORAL124_64_63]